MIVDFMKESDLDEVVSLENEIFSSPWNKEAFLYEINENEYSHNYVIKEENEIIGYCGFWCLFDQAQITTIGVKPSYQRKHYATMMMNLMLEKSAELGCETISLEVRVSNEAAKTLYQKMGFETINIRKNYYQDNHEDAYLMMKALERSVI